MELRFKLMKKSPERRLPISGLLALTPAITIHSVFSAEKSLLIRYHSALQSSRAFASELSPRIEALDSQGGGRNPSMVWLRFSQPLYERLCQSCTWEHADAIGGALG